MRGLLIEMAKLLSFKLGGQTWYNQQTYRAINQAIGRVIRHRNDYGAIILCDERFSQASSISQLPNWMKRSVKKITDYGMAINELKKFFNVAIESVSLGSSCVFCAKSF